MNARHALLTVLALGHLALVACGAAQYLPRPKVKIVKKVLKVYNSLSGADSGYSFFAPDVADQFQATFSLRDGAGRQWDEGPETSRNLEVQQRLNSIAPMLFDLQVRPTLCAAWAQWMFHRYPDADQLVVHVQTYNLPTMAEYRSGVRPEWVTISESPFARQR